MDSSLRNDLALLRASGIGPITFQKLISHFGSSSAALNASQQQLSNFGLRQNSVASIKRPAWDDIERELEWSAEDNHFILTTTDPRYPRLLKSLVGHPAILYVMGEVDLLNHLQIAIVGSRNATTGGLDTASAFAKHLAQQGITITSGLALGIDAAAHQGALLETGGTIAVVGTGLDRMYPAKHKKLAQQILEQGAIISEYPLGTSAKAEHFPQRNRIISGMSLGTLVVEAAKRSGSLITAREASNQGREVFAIPSSIHNPMARGCHQLIREGAKLVETADDILNELGPLIHESMAHNPNTETNTNNNAQLDPEYQQLIHAMGYDPISIDQLVNTTGLTVAAVSSMLLLLELDGHIATSPGGIYTRLKA